MREEGLSQVGEQQRSVRNREGAGRAGARGGQKARGNGVQRQEGRGQWPWGKSGVTVMRGRVGARAHSRQDLFLGQSCHLSSKGRWQRKGPSLGRAGWSGRQLSCWVGLGLEPVEPSSILLQDK